MSKLQTLKKILKFLDNHEEVFSQSVYSYNLDNRAYYTEAIQLEEISEMFDIDLSRLEQSGIGYYRFNYHQHLSLYGKDHNRTIAWPDTNKQPENEWLYVISFATGAYIFGKDYPTKTFQAFFNELKTYNPKYIDSANKSLYFTCENAKIVHEQFKILLIKYHSQVHVELEARRIDELKAELEKLTGVKS